MSVYVPPEEMPDIVYPVCAIRDNQTSFYPPQVEQSLKAAVRNFSMAINSMNGVMSFSPGDFTLFHIGFFNSAKGTLEPVEPMVQLATGVEVFGEKHES